jgi:uncharacterized membrane protein YfcA
MNAETLMLAAGVGAFLLTVLWVRNRDLREKYAVVWMGVAFLLLLCGLFPSAIMSFADASHLSYPSMVLFIALALVYFFSFTVSVSMSRQYRHNIRLTQEIAILEQRLRRLEMALAEKETEGGRPGPGSL